MLYCSKCKKHTDEACPKKLIVIANIKIKRVSRCFKCLAVKLFKIVWLYKIKEKYVPKTIVTQFSLD